MLSVDVKVFFITWKIDKSLKMNEMSYLIFIFYPSCLNPSLYATSFPVFSFNPCLNHQSRLFLWMKPSSKVRILAKSVTLTQHLWVRMRTTNLCVPFVTIFSKVRTFHGSNKGLNLSPLKNSPRLPYAWSFFAVSALTNAWLIIICFMLRHFRFSAFTHS